MARRPIPPMHRAALVVFSLFAAGERARAQSPPKSAAVHSDAESREAARRLDAEGTGDMDAGDLVGACPKLLRSYRIDPGIGVLLRLALCYERAGKTASAWSR